MTHLTKDLFLKLVKSLTKKPSDILNNFDAFCDKHEDEIMEFYMEHGGMPYGIQKARDGDPYTWSANAFADDLKAYKSAVNVKSLSESEVKVGDLLKQAQAALKKSDMKKYLEIAKLAQKELSQSEFDKIIDLLS